MIAITLGADKDQRTFVCSRDCDVQGYDILPSVSLRVLDKRNTAKIVQETGF